MALRIASLPKERWMVKAAEWNPELSSKYRTNRADWGDQEKDGKMTSTNSSNFEENETENSTESEYKSWIKAAKDRGRWILLEKDYTMKCETQKVSSEPTSKIRQ